MKQKEEALRLIEECLKELESAKGSVLSSVQKLARAAGIMDNSDVAAWCSIQFGDKKYTRDLQNLIDHLVDKKIDHDSKVAIEKTKKLLAELKKLKLDEKKHFSNEELNVKANESGGGYSSIGFIEERYADLVRLRRGNDGTYYKNGLNDHINYVRRVAHTLASEMFAQLKFSGTVKSCFDVLKNAADDRLLDLNPALAEQLMLAFKSVAANSIEEWSQALTTCRRLIEGLADSLSPPSDEKHNGRALGKVNYVNRLWAYMDKNIASDSNKELAKAHIDYLGSWLERINKISNKGVHSELSQIEATKAVFHTYLVVADILEIKNSFLSSFSKKNINTASIDELEIHLDINRILAKEIFKLRIESGKITIANLNSIKGVGAKTLAKAREIFELDTE